jgi:ATP-dependent RNA helicase DDX21
MKLKQQDKMIEKNGIDETPNGAKTGSLPIHLTDDDQEKGNFQNFNISKKTIKKLQDRNVDFLFPVQTQSYKYIHDQEDCLVQAYTGTGKTLAFSIPIVELLQNDKTVKLVRGRAPRVLVLAPTRELTKQISDDFQTIVNDLSVVTIYGGKKYEDQENSIRNGCDILVATPGRLKDIVDKGRLDLTKVKHVILDEVDRMLDMGFIDDVEEILGHIFTSNRETKPQFIVFSATMPNWVHKTTKKYMSKDFHTIDLVKGNTQKTSATVEHLAVLCTYQDRGGVINSLVQIYSSSSLDGRAIVFCETKKEADELSVSHDIKAEAHVLHGDIPQDKRELVLKKFREGKYRLLITTDVAARGLDIPEVDLVIVTAPPKDVESYIHRSGRTGRAGAPGKCICLYKSNQIRDLRRVEMEAGMQFTRIEPPGTADVLIASSADAAKALDNVTDVARAHFREAAEKILKTRNAVDALSAALACISGTTHIVPRSLLTKKENYTTYMLTVTDDMKGPGLVLQCYVNVSEKILMRKVIVHKLHLQKIIEMLSLIYPVNLMKNYKLIGKIVQEFK